MDCFAEFAFQIHQGNFGALEAVTKCLKLDFSNLFLLMEYCNRTGTRGSDFYVKYKECDKDAEKFLAHVRERVGPFP